MANGVYRYSASSTFPTLNYKSEGYAVDVSFTSAAPPPPDTTPPTVAANTPANSATGVATSVAPTATFSEAVQSATVGFTLKAGSTSITGTSAYNAGSSTATFTPSAALAASTTYTATIAGVKDTAGNTIAAPFTWSFTTAAVAPPDTTPPTVTATTPANNTTSVSTSATASATFSEPVQAATVGFTLNAGATGIAGTSAYNSATNTATFTPSAVLAAGTTYTATIAGVKDTAGNTITAPFTWSFTTASGPTCPCSVWSAGATPSRTDSDTGAVELGVKIRSDVAGFITGVRFYKGTGNTGTHVGNLWSSTGTLLASATFTGESSTGWQQVSFSAPVAVAANTTYVASYFAPTGHYAADNNFFTTGVDNAPLHALASGVDGTNGVYRYASSSSFPNASYQNSNYWVDVVFTTTAAPDTTPPTVTASSPANNATGIATSVAPTATFSEPVQAATVGFALNAGATSIAGTTAYNSGTNTATFTPSVALTASTTYTATIAGVKDAAGNTIAAPFSWSFTTAAAPPPDTTPPTVTTVTPTSGATGVATSVVPTATFSEPVQAATVGFTLNAGATSIAGTSAYNSATNTATFTPSAGLAANTAYTATITGVKDTAGNTITAPFSWSFTTTGTTSVTLTDTSVADFSAGTGSGTAVVQTTDGEVALAPAAGDEFSGSVLPAGWTSTTVASGGTTTLGLGLLSLNGNRVNTSATYSAGRSLEFVATFRENNQNVGFGSTLGSSTPYAVFGMSGGNLQAQTRSNIVSSSSTGLGTTYLNAPHRFRVDWNAANVVYSVDGVVVATHTRTLTSAMSLVARDSTTGATPLIVDWMRLGPYPTTGTFTSRVLDAGQSLLYDTISWTTDLPTGSSVTVQVRTGNTAVPDGSWTAYSTVTSGASVGKTARYAQYQVTLTRGTAVLTPALNALSVIAHT